MFDLRLVEDAVIPLPLEALNTCHKGICQCQWSLLKPGVIGTFHNVSNDYLPLYLAEFSFRLNYRESRNIFTEFVATYANMT
jgi:hypothetical protein